MRYCQIFLVSLSIALLLFLAGDTLSVSAHGQSGNCQWHYVQHGETLSGIARMYGTSWQTLARVNGLHNPNVIRAGSTLCIPTGYQAYQAPTYHYMQPHYTQPKYYYRNPNNMTPGYGAQSYQAPSYQAPSQQGSGYSAPGYQAPAQQAPGYAPPPAPSQAGQVVVVRVDDFAFIPRTVKIQAGQTVVWKRAKGTHNVRADDGSFGNDPDNTWTEFSHTFTAAGTFPYFCQVHGGPGGMGMSGIVVVQ